MQHFQQSPTDPDFVQNPYSFYSKLQKSGSIVYWDDYDSACATTYPAVSEILRHRGMGRQIPTELIAEHPAHQTAFWDVEDHSMLELDGPRHARLRGLVLRAFTSRRIKELTPDIQSLSHQLIDQIDTPQFDLIATFAERLPIIIIARLLGVPEHHAPDLLNWSHAMVGMYQAKRTMADELAAAKAAQDFSAFMTEYISFRRNRPKDDLITHLIAAEEDGEKLSTPELITTCILLLNAGHEATVHSLGNAVKTLLETETKLDDHPIDTLVEETIRFDPPLHMFTRWVYDDIEIDGHLLKKNTQVACLLAAANRDPQHWDQPDTFIPDRPIKTNTSFGGGAHFCIGAPLARLELKIALPILFERLPDLHIETPPSYSNNYHFHGLSELILRR